MKSLKFILHVSQNKKSSVVLFLVLTCLQGSLFAQSRLDSLFDVWEDSNKPDTIRAIALGDYIHDGPFNSNPDSAIVLADKLYDFTKKINYPKGTVDALNLRGYLFFRTGNYPLALSSYREGLSITEEINYKIGTADILLRTGFIYHDNEDVINALKYYQRSLKIYQEINDLDGIGSIYNEFGSIYNVKGDFDKALDYYLKSIAINKELDFEIGNSAQYINIGSLYLSNEDFEKALEYFQKGLAIERKKNDKLGMASALSGIGSVYSGQQNYTEALDYLEEALEISQGINDVQGSASIILSISDIYLNQENYLKVIQLCEKSLALSKQVGDLGGQEYAYESLYEAYRAIGNTNKALQYHEEMILISDSIRTEETAIKLQQIEFSKQVMEDSLLQVEKDLEVQMKHQKEVQKKDKNRNLAIGVGLICFLLAIGFFTRWRYVRKSRAIIEKEKNRSENLLLNILPAEIAEELKEKGEASARDFELVSILFTDFKGFTEKSAELSAADLIGEINHCFKAFDLICERYGVEKIKTIGDAYMAAGGLPVPSKDSVINTVLAALEMQSYMSQRLNEKEFSEGFTFEMRLGIHTGPVVAGIVGVKKFQYDIWGDTVNTASRMESNGAVGKVNISQDTYELIKDDSRLKFIHRGKIKAKGKGEIDMWFVEKV
ncbi:adenylate/guanylate cyclase domain-containing protein [Maribacter sp. PR1]|uniref:Adenylate/guanylate cyclase domain-containing protein n=1 Tax=Maribacter cobaltidurans TaxID=1178778 RepID=A0ABU7IUW5_9FLAO|nr:MULTISPECIES: adenylate/guanylate cyclase domain-containing protein [Maribacter]MDC6389388.1 adenylate/guanylate cyclase domain-containing protein [Maribacter sp. PR1]MEE1976777.1 adenylate/guanylate cyclase domain-containing protein [Maribacter cobaltidurans]